MCVYSYMPVQCWLVFIKAAESCSQLCSTAGFVGAWDLLLELQLVRGYSGILIFSNNPILFVPVLR